MNYKDINDYELMYLVRDEDEQYTKLLYEKYKPLIGKICQNYLKMYSFLDKDDLYQEGYLGFNYAINNYDGSKVKFYTYLDICVKSKINDYIKKIMNNKNISLNTSISFSMEIDEGLSLGDIICDNDSTTLNVFYNEFLTNLIHFKNNLNNIESEIFELKVNGFRTKEISSLLDIKLKIVSYHIMKIKDKLKKKNIVDCFF